MFECVAPAVTFKKILEAIKELVDIANFDITHEGIQLQAMDTSHVALVSLLLKGESFRHFRVDQPVLLGIKLAEMAKILKCGDNNDELKLSSKEGSGELIFAFTSPNGERTSEFPLKLMEVDAESLGIPERKYDCVVRMPSAEFQRNCRDLATFGDTVLVSITKGDISFGVQGGGSVTLKGTTAADVPEANAVVLLVEETVTMTYALRYFISFAKATTLAPVVTLSMSRDIPMVIEYAVEQMGYIKFFLAPKIDD